MLAACAVMRGHVCFFMLCDDGPRCGTPESAMIWCSSVLPIAGKCSVTWKLGPTRGHSGCPCDTCTGGTCDSYPQPS